MTYPDIIKFVGSLTDDELLTRTEMAHADLISAVPQSDWQDSCFAGLLVFTDEMGRRGLKRDFLLANV